MPEFKPQCIWCGAAWSDANIELEDVYSSSGCETCGYGSDTSATITIRCHECKKVMYQKEGRWS